ncbi:predicted protein [Histoplasma capsulatum var. duboisii H88]|uniref:Predicted protein n=1 Tax=Ajellomyces capsulatus (strain H88) TaxID=544711 RepID=F0UKX0_AJEC8|nr:predicted protein [Histoplasma capsulatum var. duboisii H88]
MNAAGHSSPSSTGVVKNPKCELAGKNYIVDSGWSCRDEEFGNPEFIFIFCDPRYPAYCRFVGSQHWLKTPPACRNEEHIREIAKDQRPSKLMCNLPHLVLIGSRPFADGWHTNVRQHKFANFGPLSAMTVCSSIMLSILDEGRKIIDHAPLSALVGIVRVHSASRIKATRRRSLSFNPWVISVPSSKWHRVRVMKTPGSLPAARDESRHPGQDQGGN